MIYYVIFIVRLLYKIIIIYILIIMVFIMKKYLVGGAVRDLLLKLPVKEKDWVITGSSPQEMLNIGYEQVGKDFPVFLHPDNHEEYALARTERKSGEGYTGFFFHTKPSVTIEEDLYRRDLTINAMAYDVDGTLLDPYNGQRDIKLRLLRHVSNAFPEDPLRVLRVARFAAKFKNLGFTIAPETLKLMTDMIHELKSISSERVWIETKKALDTNNPQVYFQVLRKCGALKILFPELDELFLKFNWETRHLYNNQKSLGDCTMQKLSIMACLSANISIRFAMLCCNLKTSSKFISKPAKTRIIKQSKSLLSIDNLCNRLKIPRNIYKLSQTISIYSHYLYDITTLNSDMIIEIFGAFNCWKIPKKIEQIIFVNKVNLLTKKYNKNFLYIQEKMLRIAFTITTQVKTSDIITDGFTGSNISKELYSRRLKILNTWNRKIL